MALLVPLARVLRGVWARAGPGACGAAPRPPCPPCHSAPPPPCRAHAPPAPRARRVLCCAPPQGSRPPCAPRLPACSLTCDSRAKTLKSSSQAYSRDKYRITSTKCEVDQDPVAERLKLAKRAQRAEYEREVADRAALVPPAPPARDHYRLAGERECARATDGCVYAVLPSRPAPAPAPDPAPRRCGPGRTPPPPRCVQLAHDDGCRIKSNAHLDPCAHQPRVMIEIDRSSNHVVKSNPASPKGFTGSDECKGTQRPARPSWCADPPKPASPPPRCRRPSIAERLRARHPESRTERRIHTSVSASAHRKSGKCNSGGSKGSLHLKKHLKEAGLGRVVVDRTSVGKQAPPPGGELDLRVPPGTARVAVRVSLHKERGPDSECPAPAPSTPLPTPSPSKKNSSSCKKFTSTPEKRDSWLSIKSIQKKISGPCHPGPGHLKAGSEAPGSGQPESRVARASPRAPRSPTEPNAVAKQYSSTAALLANTITVNA